ncbi:hypothetical protein KOW79_001892 [Hemibagrus wyckioides]|uniref:Uncharacterized protein n=1 Tax=Hemibagrus wyckioides TaxID=337641 RepID=A0A9D3P764_9TELE|nr:hypothetical protein KOW79_001892 [Hemibagrus wyckioides]
MASSTVLSEPIDVLHDDDDDDGYNLSDLEDKDVDEETLGLDENDSADEIEDEKQLPPPAKKPRKSAQSKSPPAWETPEDADVSPQAIQFRPARLPGDNVEDMPVLDTEKVALTSLKEERKKGGKNGLSVFFGIRFGSSSD